MNAAGQQFDLRTRIARVCSAIERSQQDFWHASQMRALRFWASALHQTDNEGNMHVISVMSCQIKSKGYISHFRGLQQHDYAHTTHSAGQDKQAESHRLSELSGLRICRPTTHLYDLFLSTLLFAMYRAYNNTCTLPSIPLILLRT